MNFIQHGKSDIHPSEVLTDVKRVYHQIKIHEKRFSKIQTFSDIFLSTYIYIKPIHPCVFFHINAFHLFLLFGTHICRQNSTFASLEVKCFNNCLDICNLPNVTDGIEKKTNVTMSCQKLSDRCKFSCTEITQSTTVGMVVTLSCS